MTRLRGESVDRAGWRLVIPESVGTLSAWARKEIAQNALAAIAGSHGGPFRRSRHATTWKVRVAGPNGESTNVFVKQLDPPGGLAARLKAILRTKRAEHVLRISEDLRRQGFGVPEVLLIGTNHETGREVIVTTEAPGFMLTRWMNPAHRVDVKLRRTILRRLGAEIARLHLAGYIHGDLTPYNVFADGGDKTVITFIDHEGTKKTSRIRINGARNRMRNLVQLGHFDLPGVSRADKMRVFASYAAAMSLSKSSKRRCLHRLLKMIQRRRGRDRALNLVASSPTVIAGEGTVRG